MTPLPKRSAGSTTGRQERMFGALEAVEMAQTEHPVDVPFGIHDAGRDVIAAAEIADDRDDFERFVLVVEALIGAEIHLREPTVPVEIGAFRFDETLDIRHESISAELLFDALDAHREAVEFGLRVGVKRGHRSV